MWSFNNDTIDQGAEIIMALLAIIMFGWLFAILWAVGKVAQLFGSRPEDWQP